MLITDLMLSSGEYDDCIIVSDWGNLVDSPLEKAKNFGYITDSIVNCLYNFGDLCVIYPDWGTITDLTYQDFVDFGTIFDLTYSCQFDLGSLV